MTTLNPQINRCNSPCLPSAANVNGCAVTAAAVFKLTAPVLAFHFYFFFFTASTPGCGRMSLARTAQLCGTMSDLLTQNIHPSKSSSSSQQAAGVSDDANTVCCRVDLSRCSRRKSTGFQDCRKSQTRFTDGSYNWGHECQLWKSGARPLTSDLRQGQRFISSSKQDTGTLDRSSWKIVTVQCCPLHPGLLF